MKISAKETQSVVRKTLAEHLRLKRPQTTYAVDISLQMDAREAAAIAELDRKLLARWAGPQLSGIIGTMAQPKPSIRREARSPAEVQDLTRRARIFASLVSFAVAEGKLAQETRRGLDVAPAPPDDSAPESAG
jgi:hypothetical protein